MAEVETAHHLEKHEPGGIAVWPIVAIAASFTLFVAAGVAGLYLYYAWSTRDVAPPFPRPFPKPQLQSTPLSDLHTLQQRQEAQLKGYAWVDRDRGIIRIPIQRALQMIAARGADAYNPVTSGGAPENAPGGAPANAAPAQPAPESPATESHP
ncbi:MAG: hypothetical protein ACLPWS_07245 [Rhodomicrobium sp.]